MLKLLSLHIWTILRETPLHAKFPCSFQNGPSPNENLMLVNPVDNLLLENSYIISEVPYPFQTFLFLLTLQLLLLPTMMTVARYSRNDDLLQDTELNPSAEPFIPILNDFSFNGTSEGLPSGNVSSIDDSDNPANILKQLKSTNTEPGHSSHKHQLNFK